MRGRGEMLDDEDFVRNFEDLTLDAEHFDHRGHLRLAWLYLGRYDLETAIERISRGIHAYATSLGAPGKFHRTITDSMMRITARRIDILEDRSWRAFQEQNRDLFEAPSALLARHFSAKRLESEEARRVALAPDREEI